MSRGWRILRRALQLMALVIFLYLFRRTELSDADELSVPVNFLFRLDPLSALTGMLAAHRFLWNFWPAFLVLLVTATLGRLFCGWICPVGTLLDLSSRLFPRTLLRRTRCGSAPAMIRWRMGRFIALAAVLIGAVVAFPLAGFLNPFSLWFRAMALSVDPLWSRGFAFLSPWLEKLPLGSGLSEWLKANTLAFHQVTYALGGVSLAIALAMIAGELVARRFWCRYLCPSGALMSLTHRWSLLRRRPLKSCAKCPATESCAQRCRMGAFDETGKLNADACTLCMDCLAECPNHAVKFKVVTKTSQPLTPSLSRRGFLVAGAAGAALPAAGRLLGNQLPSDPHRLRPPGTPLEAEFLNQCIRCGECIKVCPTQALHPGELDGGLKGLFAPVLIPRLGYCEQACTLCGQVCPTGAIALLTREQKATSVIGKAFIDKTKCLPWAKKEECICCEEHCPLPVKAIEFKTIRVKGPDGKELEIQQPHVICKRCIGCGICENKCPLDGESAIRVESHESHRQRHARPQKHGESGESEKAEAKKD